MSGCDCDDARTALEEYLRSEICATQREAIRAHLEGCPDCTHEFEVSEALVSVVRRACGESAPATVRAKILEAIQSTPCGRGERAPDAHP